MPAWVEFLLKEIFIYFGIEWTKEEIAKKGVWGVARELFWIDVIESQCSLVINFYGRMLGTCYDMATYILPLPCRKKDPVGGARDGCASPT